MKRRGSCVGGDVASVDTPNLFHGCLNQTAYQLFPLNGLMSMGSTENDRSVADFGHDFGLYTLADVFPAIFGVVALVIYSRAFGTAAYGRYSLAMVIVSVGSTAIFGWLEQAILRFESDQDSLLSTSFGLILVLSFITGSIGILGLLLFESTLSEFQDFYIVAILGAISIGIFNVLRAVFQARLEPRRVTLYKFINSLFKLTIGIALSFFVINSITGWLWGGVLAGIIAILFMIAHLDIDQLSFDLNLVYRLTRYGIPMIGWLFGLSLLTFVDRILIEGLSTTSAVGIYSSNYTIVQTGLPLVLSPIIQTAHPVIMDKWNGNNLGLVEEMIKEYSRYFLILGVGATIFAGAISRPLSTLVLGEGFHEGYAIIPIIGASLFFWNFAMIGHKGLELRESTGIMTGGILLSVIANVGLNYALIPLFGYLGAALATMISSFIYLLFAFISSRYTVQWEIPATTAQNVVVAGGIMTIVNLTPYIVAPSIRMLPLPIAIFGSFVYLGVLRLLNEIRSDELRELSSMVI